MSMNFSEALRAVRWQKSGESETLLGNFRIRQQVLSRMDELPNSTFRTKQVHGSRIVELPKRNARDAGLPETLYEAVRTTEADGLWTDDPEAALAVQTADCLPIVLVSGRMRCLIHAGWRGLQKGIVAEAVTLLLQQGAQGDSSIDVHIGPCICPRHYEVSEELLKAFAEEPLGLAREQLLSAFARTGEAAWILDLRGIATALCLNAGIRPDRILISPRCTFEDPSLPSYRRDGKQATRLVTLCTPKA